MAARSCVVCICPHRAHLLALRGGELAFRYPMAPRAGHARSETQHRGEVLFAAEPALDTAALFAGQSARERAIEVFSVLRLWDTEERNGVLIYLLMADRDIEIVADRGVSAKVVAAEWEAICREMETALRRGEYGEAVVAGIEALAAARRHFPRVRVIAMSSGPAVTRQR